MKKYIVLLALSLATLTTFGQTYKVDKNGEIVEMQSKKVIPTETIYRESGGRTFYKGAKGGIYFYRVSKSGKKYKVYVKREDENESNIKKN